MTTDRTFVILMTFLLMMSGCFGATSNADAEEDPIDDSTESQTNQTFSVPINSPPIISTSITTAATFYNGLDCTSQGVELEVRHAMTDWDGDIISAGWDINLDGIIDFPASDSEGYTNISIPLSGMLERTVSNSVNFERSIVFGAMDNDGAWTSSEIYQVTIGKGYFDSYGYFIPSTQFVSLPCDDFSDVTDYDFNVIDHQDNVTEGDLDNLFEISRTNGQNAISMSRISILISSSSINLPQQAWQENFCGMEQTPTVTCEFILENGTSAHSTSLWNSGDTILLRELSGKTTLGGWSQQTGKTYYVGIYIDGIRADVEQVSVF